MKLRYGGPQDKSCFYLCRSCYRCVKKNSSSCPSPFSCSGRPEYVGGHKWGDDDRDDACRCSEGILQIRLKSGQFVRHRMTSSPYKGSVKMDKETQDERDWNSYVQSERERLDDPFYDPITSDDGSGLSDMASMARSGLL